MKTETKTTGTSDRKADVKPGSNASSDYASPAAYDTHPPLARNYAEKFLIFDHGKGVWIWDKAGNKYLDFGSGIAVNSFGHGRADFAKIVSDQMKKVVHVSNLYSTRETMNLARRLVAASPRAKDQPFRALSEAEWEKGGQGPYFKAVHLGNSGTEANEAALKYARIYQQRKAEAGNASGKTTPNGTGFLAFENAFHGRTMGALSVTWSKVYREINEPLIPGVSFVPFNDVAALRARLDKSFAAVIVEPIQGEGGLTPMTKEFATELNRLCRELDVVLIADEIQSGTGRTGYLFASQMVGLEPDIVSLAKPLAGGLPLSATLLRPKIADIVHPGDHGTTFGGGPVTSALASYVWDSITAPGFLEGVREKSGWLEDGLSRLKKRYKFIGELRGAGMLRGLVIDLPLEGPYVTALVELCRLEGLIVLRSGKNVLRIAPPLIMTKAEMNTGLAILDRVFAKVEAGALAGKTVSDH